MGWAMFCCDSFSVANFNQDDRLPDVFSIGSFFVDEGKYPAVMPILYSESISCSSDGGGSVDVGRFFESIAVQILSQSLRRNRVIIYDPSLDSGLTCLESASDVLSDYGDVRKVVFVRNASEFERVVKALRDELGENKRRIATRGASGWADVIAKDDSCISTWVIVRNCLSLSERSYFADFSELVKHGPKLGACFWIDTCNLDDGASSYQLSRKMSWLSKIEEACHFSVSIDGGVLRFDRALESMQPLSTYSSFGDIYANELTDDDKSKFKEMIKFSKELNRAAIDISDFIEIDIGVKDAKPYTLRIGPRSEVYHGMLAGKTGGGKTIFLKHLLASICEKYGPEEVSIRLFDFKDGMNLSFFRGVPNFKALIKGEDDPLSIMNALDEIQGEAKRRNEIFIDAQSRGFLGEDISEYNKWAVTKGEQQIPVDMLVIDEFARVYKYLDDNNKRKFNKQLKDAARTSRSQGIVIILVSQSFSGLTVVDEIRGQFQLRMSLQVDVPGDCQWIFESGNSVAYRGLAQEENYREVLINSKGGRTSGNEIVRLPIMNHPQLAKRIALLKKEGVFPSDCRSQEKQKVPPSKQEKPGRPEEASFANEIFGSVSELPEFPK